MREFAFHELSLLLGDLVDFVEHVQTWDIHPIACGRSSANTLACEHMTRTKSGEDNANHCPTIAATGKGLGFRATRGRETAH